MSLLNHVIFFLQVFDYAQDNALDSFNEKGEEPRDTYIDTTLKDKSNLDRDYDDTAPDLSTEDERGTEYITMLIKIHGEYFRPFTFSCYLGTLFQNDMWSIKQVVQVRLKQKPTFPSFGTSIRNTFNPNDVLFKCLS